MHTVTGEGQDEMAGDRRWQRIICIALHINELLNNKRARCTSIIQAWHHAHALSRKAHTAKRMSHKSKKQQDKQDDLVEALLKTRNVLASKQKVCVKGLVGTL